MTTALLSESDVHARLEALSESVRVLRDLFEYAVLRPVDLVLLDGDPYFCYVRDLAYTFLAETRTDAFVRNYALTDSDLQSPTPFAFTVSDFLESHRRGLPRTEQYFKMVALAHLWHHGVDFTMLDVGANIGWCAVPCAKFIRQFGRSNAIHCFEPGLAADLLPANIRLNRVGDLIQAHRVAVSDVAAPVAFNSMLGHSVCDSVVDFRKHYPHLVPAMSRIVDAVTIDQFLAEQRIDSPLVLKIDAEGHDWQVLRGASEARRRGQVAVTFVEFVPHYLKEHIAPEEMLAELACDCHLLGILELGKGYSWRARALPQDARGLRQFADEVARCPLRYTDILAVSREVPQAEQLCARLCDH